MRGMTHPGFARVAALLFALVLALGFAGCKACNEDARESASAGDGSAPPAKAAPLADGDGESEWAEVPDDKPFIEYRDFADGDRVTKMMVVHPPKQDVEPLPDYPPAAKAFVIMKQDELVQIVRFPEYTERDKMSANGYGLLNVPDKEAIVIDPGLASVRMVRFWLDEVARAELKAIVVTHGHLDHTGGVAMLKEAYPNARFIAPKADADWMRTPDPLLFGALPAEPPPAADQLASGGELIEAAGLVLKAIATPGHTKGSLSYALPEQAVVFTGDTLFYRNIGATRFKQSLGVDVLIDSIKKRLGKLPPNTEIYPGHGRPSSIGEEFKHNRHLTDPRRK